MIYVPANTRSLPPADDEGWRRPGEPEIVGLADLTWSPPEQRDTYRGMGYYWVSFWSGLEAVCHWDRAGYVWRSTGDEREWKSQDLDRVWEAPLCRR